MKKYICLLLFTVLYVHLFSQNEHFECTTEGNNNNGLLYTPVSTSNTYNSTYGVNLPTVANIRALTIFINIIYDQTPSSDPYPTTNSYWPVPTTNCINSPVYKPSYMLDVFDVNMSSTNTYNGCITRLYAESSFNNLIILSDYMVVNIKQSQIAQVTTFTTLQLLNAVITYINNNGGLNTYYGHNSAYEYDTFTNSSSYGQMKTMQSDGKIDLLCFITRNAGTGIGGNANTYFPTVNLKIGNQEYGYNNTTYQEVGNHNFAQQRKNVFTHEIAHLLLGSNEMHTTNREGSNGGTFLGLQGGFSLFGGGLLTCNAYERWRLGWKNDITANNVNSDITTQFTGEQTFTLRDFITYGDAIRIKLPYKDKTTSLNQYIWLENHQVGKNNKQDGYIHNDVADCRKVNQAGIYAYYQIGKNNLESSVYSDVFPSGESDNLKTISAEGNYNVTYNNNEEDCFAWAGSSGRPKFTYNSQNVFQGINNQTAAVSNSANSTLIYDNLKHTGSKIKDGVFYNNLPFLGSNVDAFVPNPETKIDISTNPAAVNTLTYYLNIDGNKNISQKSNANTLATRKIYLTGLSIKIIDPNPSNTAMKTYTVKIRWDDYDVKQNVNWAGDIVLKEKLNLLENKTVTLEQNFTPIQLTKDPVSNFFAPPTKFTCENGTQTNLLQNSQIILKDKSSFVLESGANLLIQNNAQIIVKSGSTLILKSSSSLQVFGRGKIVIENGAYLCVENGASIKLQDFTSVILLRNGAILGAHPNLFSNTNCISSISNIQKTGAGAFFEQNNNVYIQNETISSNRFVAGKNIYVGSNVTNTKPYGDVIITNNAQVILEAEEEIYIEKGIDVKLGSELEIK